MVYKTEIKMELHEEIDISLVCRGCLGQAGEMKNMTEWGLTEDFYRATNIRLSISDEVSHLICLSCEDMLIKCRKFVILCQQSDEFLKNTAKKKNAAKEDTEKNVNSDLKKNTVSSVMLEHNLVITILAPNTGPKIFLPCPYQCQESFLKKNDLLQHLIKFHKKDPSFCIDLQYYCSFNNCPYYINSGKSKFFNGRKFLNQHYNKVHKTKQFACDACKSQFSIIQDYNRHLKTCNFSYECQICNVQYKTNEKLLVHLLRKHPALHEQYKNERKAEKRKSKIVAEAKKIRTESDKAIEYICDSPKRSFATQTSNLENIKNDVTLPSWSEKTDEAKKDEISTQTVFEDLLSLKSQNSEDESMFFETVSLSDIQTQTFPLEFGLSRSNKETITSETQSPDLSLKGTQTCFCLYDSPKLNRFADSVSSSPTLNLTSTETQTTDLKTSLDTDVLLSFSSTETQTCFDEVDPSSL